MTLRWAGRPRPRRADVAIVQYTSGSTGRPRGVRVRHDSVSANVAAIADRFELTAVVARAGLAAALPRHGPHRRPPGPGRGRHPGPHHAAGRLPQVAAVVAAADHRERRDGQRRAGLRVRPVRAARPGARGRRPRRARPVAVAGRLQRRRVGPQPHPDRVLRDVRRGRLPPGGVPAVLRAGRGDAHGHRRPLAARARRGQLRHAGAGTAGRGRRPGPVDPVGDGTEGEIWVAGPHVTSGYLSGREQDDLFGDLDGVRHLRTGDLGYRRAASCS